MKANQIKGLLHDILHLRCWRNPLSIPHLDLKEKSYPGLRINLLTGKITPSAREPDSLSELLQEKRKWFKDFLKSHNSKLSDFEKAEIKMSGKKEVVEIVYNGKKYERERVW